jgi:predicted nucleic acid-binding Zn ribbon protein
MKPYKPYKDSSRSANATPLKEAIEAMLKAYKIEHKISETFIISSWEKIMGASIAARTGKIFIRNKILYAEINSSALKQDLSMAKQKMIDLLNKSAGSIIITDVVIK